MYAILNDEEIHRVLVEARHYGGREKGLKWPALISLLANYGPRISEALALRWDQIDFARQTITLPTLKRRKPMTRTLPLLQGVADVLTEYRHTANGDSRVFPMSKSGRFIVWHAFQVMLTRAGIPRTKLHTLRHSCATRLVQKDLAVARDVLGHANIATTDRYIHAVRMREQFSTLQALR